MNPIFLAMCWNWMSYWQPKKPKPERRDGD